MRNTNEEMNMDDGVAFVHKSLEERIEESGEPLSFGEEIDWGEPRGTELY